MKSPRVTLAIATLGLLATTAYALTDLTRSAYGPITEPGAISNSVALASPSGAEKARKSTPERRLAWCHLPWGMDKNHDWDATCRFAKEQGFTDLLANLAWGGCAFYPSKVLPRAEGGPCGDALEQCKAACRKYGLKMHVWKVCWYHGEATSKAFSSISFPEPPRWPCRGSGLWRRSPHPCW